MKEKTRFEQNKAKLIIDIIDRVNADRKTKAEMKSQIKQLINEIAKCNDPKAIRALSTLKSHIAVLLKGIGISSKDFNFLLSLSNLDPSESLYRQYQVLMMEALEYTLDQLQTDCHDESERPNAHHRNQTADRCLQAAAQ